MPENTKKGTPKSAEAAASNTPKAEESNKPAAGTSSASAEAPQATTTTAPTPNTTNSSATTNSAEGSVKMDADNASGADASQAAENDKSKEVLVRYMTDLAVRVDAVERKKISEINLYNIREVINQASQGIEDKQLINHATMAYSVISGMLFNLIQNHVRGIQDDLTHGRITYNGKGSISFKGTMLYLKHKDGGIKVMSSVNDPAFTYQFLMLRSINGKRAHTLEPNFKISFKIDADTYTGNEVLMKFNYIDQDGQDVSSHLGSKLNPKAAAILSADKEEVTKIARNVFERHKDECNILKNALPAHQMIVCTGFSKASDSDAMIKFFSCLEAFQLAHDTSLCGAASFEEEFEF